MVNELFGKTISKKRFEVIDEDFFKWNCALCKHFHIGVRDRCNKGNNWVLNDGYCQDFERVRSW